MRILVLIRTADDVRIPPRRDARSGRVRPEWQVRRLDPAAARALDIALALKTPAGGGAAVGAASAAPGDAGGPPGVEVVALVIGPEEDEATLREALARGCDEVVRVWDEECVDLRAPGAALVMAAAARAAGCDLVLAGTASADTASGQVGVLVAHHLGVPCVTQAAELEVGPISEAGAARGGPASGPSSPAGTPSAEAAARGAGDTSVRVARVLAGGWQEVVEAPLPAVVTVLARDLDTTAPPFPAVLAASARPVPVWGIAELGVPAADILRADGPLRHGRVRTPRPAVRSVPAPDPAAAAFDRIGELVRGTVRRREGRMSAATSDLMADELFEALRGGGWLDHLRDEPPE